MTKAFQLTLSDEQARTVVAALDLYSRIGMGQIEEVMEVLNHADHLALGCDRTLAERLLKQVAEEMFGDSAYGICNQKVPNTFRVAWDVRNVLRHRVAWTNNPAGGWTVDFDLPTQTGSLPLATAEAIEVPDTK